MIYIACPTDDAGEPDWDKAHAFSDETAAVAACVDETWLAGKSTDEDPGDLNCLEYYYYPLRKGSSPASP